MLIAIIFFVITTTATAGLVTEGLKASWNFNTTIEDSWDSHDGTLYGTETYVDSPYGRAMYFDGSTYISIAEDPDGDLDLITNSLLFFGLMLILFPVHTASML